MKFKIKFKYLFLSRYLLCAQYELKKSSYAESDVLHKFYPKF